jgi:predicted esterase
MSQKHNINVNKTATYYTLGNLKTTKTIWFVLHGYGYLAKDFIQFFQPIVTENNLIVAPEGFSKFYTTGVEGKIGASWMTKENREEEIADYTNYLNQLFETILTLVETPNVKINILGFSQGGATASRWISDGQIKCNNFILWASVFPDDMNFEKITTNNTFFLYGDDDVYVTKERVTQQKGLISNSGLDIKTTIFKGKHEIPSNVLKEQTELNNW